MALSESSASARRARAIKSLLEKPALPPRKVLKKTDSDPSSTPLLNQETAARWKWASRLEAIGRKAGSHSKLLQDTTNSEGLSAAETARLRQLVLSSGAPRTMAVHISTWERFDEWLTGEGIPLFPLSSDKVLKYALDLDRRECGPTVVPSLRTAIKWVTSKLAIECPDMSNSALLALQAEVIQKRAATLKEAVPIPIVVVGCMEKFVTDENEPEEARLFVWWWLCMVFASLRFDDAVHVKPAELIMTDEGMYGVAWQTKVEPKRRGTKFVVPHVGFKDSGWLQTGWVLLHMEDLDRDYWIRDLNTQQAFRDGPAAYQRSMQWLRFFAKRSLLAYFVGPEAEIKAATARIQGLTAHSARVTLLDAAVHAGRSTEEIGLQANWKNPGPLVLKYTRNRTSVPAQMVQQLVKDMVDQAHPFEAPDDAVLDTVDEAALDEVQFFAKTTGSRANQDFRYHCSQLGNTSALACQRLAMEDCTATGSALPDISMLCKHCLKARPDIASRCFTAQ